MSFPCAPIDFRSNTQSNRIPYELWNSNLELCVSTSGLPSTYQDIHCPKIHLQTAALSSKSGVGMYSQVNISFLTINNLNNLHMPEVTLPIETKKMTNLQDTKQNNIPQPYLNALSILTALPLETRSPSTIRMAFFLHIDVIVHQPQTQINLHSTSNLHAKPLNHQ